MVINSYYGFVIKAISICLIIVIVIFTILTVAIFAILIIVKARMILTTSNVNFRFFIEFAVDITIIKPTIIISIINTIVIITITTIIITAVFLHLISQSPFFIVFK